ncbi:MAG: MMPL family transporter [Gammaproteobacteria bacterium]|nr:MMPL family transporter [Gammaproteobacteria bacterium]
MDEAKFKWTDSMASYLFALYSKTVLQRPLVTLVITAVIVGFFLAHVTDFELDASADSLILENDASLKYYRSVREEYGSDDFLIVTYSPGQPLFSTTSLSHIRKLRDELASIKQVDSVISLLDVPLVSSPPTTLKEMAKQVRTLESDDVDIRLAEKELTSSALYENLLVSSQGDTTAIMVNLKQDVRLTGLTQERDLLIEKKLTQSLDRTERLQLADLRQEVRNINLQRKQAQEQAIRQVRATMDKHRDVATLYLGGVPMIVTDSIDYIRGDLKVFGAGVVGFIIVILSLSFGSIRWVLLPLTACITSALVMMGFLGWMQWPVTVVSSNFISLLLIVTLSLIIHLIVRYRELANQQAEFTQAQLVSEMIASKFVPCVYTAITTMVAFGSLLVSGIRPVIDFGWMMVIGISISFVLAFTLFPAILMLLPRLDQSKGNDLTGTITASIAQFIQDHSKATLLLFTILAAIGLAGLPQLSVENRFIDYYKADTEIYQGMSLIDEKLGGTTPLDVIVDAPPDDFGDDDSGLDLTDLLSSGDITSSSYWFNSDGLLEIAEMHEYLESLPETGKVLSLHTGMQLLQALNDNQPYGDFELAIVYKRLPEEIKETLIAPYLSADGNQIHFSIRIYESDKSLKRQALLDKIRNHFVTELGLENTQVNISGMAVLYNNLLQSLFKSQILTIGVVFFVILIMFILLFKALRLSIAAIVPNMIAAGLILGLMGWFGIPLDIMTITIAAISIGIGVDNSIHYVHRFRTEFGKDQDYWAAIKRCHGSIGYALYYTTVTVVLGFSILSLSNFIPTIYFGLLSGLAMITALVANLMLLPVLIARYKLA